MVPTVAHKASNLGRAIRKSQCIARDVGRRLTGNKKGQMSQRSKLYGALGAEEAVERYVLTKRTD